MENKEIIELILDAKNLSDKELKEAAIAVEKLGKKASEAEKELANLKVNRENLKRFIELKDEIAKLEDQVVRSKIENDDYIRSIGKISEATKEQRIQIEKNKLALKDQKSSLSSSKREYEKLSKSLSAAGIGVQRYNSSLEKQEQKIRDLSARLSKINEQYLDSAKSLKVSYLETKKLQEQRELEAKRAREQEEALQALIKQKTLEHNRNQQLIADAKKKVAADLAAEKSAKELAEAEKLAAQEKVKLNLINERLAENKRKQNELDKKAAKRQEELRKAHQRAIRDQERRIQKQRELLAAQKKEEAETRRVNSALVRYAEQIERLNRELRKGKISKQKYIKEEIRLRQELKLTEAQVKSTAAALRDKNSLEGKSKATDKLTRLTRRLAQAYTVLTAAQQAAAAVGATVKGYGDLEAAITKVEKTTSLTKDQLGILAEQLQVLSSEYTPTATNELLRFAEVAGQLGADSTEELMQVVTAADALGVSTNLAGDEAVKLLVRMLKMTNEGIPAINNLSSSLVELGNNFAADEAEIAEMTKEIIIGTRAIDLSSRAAAAYGATLKEMGQTGERTRTAFSTLSSVIQNAALDGGEALEQLSEVTGLTGDQIKESLGSDSERVLTAFIDGLAKVKQEGGSVNRVLQQFGITSNLAGQVFGALAGGSERLAEAIQMSNHAFQDGNRHLLEAAKQYATQESSLLRLQNKFTKLTALVGEAFSDETNSVIGEMNDLLDENSSYVTTLVNDFSDLTKEIFEFGESLDNALDSLGFYEFVIKPIVTLVKTFVNDVQIGLNVITAAVYRVREAWAEWTGASEEEINRLRDAQDKAFKDMEKNIQDLKNAEDDYNNKSSSTYRDLKESAEKYKDAISLLTEKQQEQLKVALKRFDNSKEAERQYIKLTAALVRAARAQEIQAEAEKRAAELKRTSEKLEKQRIKINKELADSNVNLIELERKYNEELKKGTITKKEHAIALEKIKEKVEETVTGIKLTGDSVLDLVDAEVKGSEAVRDLKNQLADKSKQLVKLNEQLKAQSRSSSEYAETLRKINNITRELDDTRSKFVITQELENKSKAQLLQIQRQLTIELDRYRKQKEIGVISQEEFEQKTKELNTTLEILNNQLNQTSDSTSGFTGSMEEMQKSIEEGNEALQERISLMRESIGVDKDSGNAQQKNTLIADEMASALSLWAVAQNRLNAELDYSGFTTEQLENKYKQLGKEFQSIRVTVSGWFDDLHRMNNEALRRERNAIRETLVLRKWQEQVESGKISLEQLNEVSRKVDRGLGVLADEQLQPLRSSIQSARREFQSLSDEINDNFNSVEDRLDAILGNEQEIVKRRFKKEMDELLSLLDRARETGDSELIRRTNEAIQKLKKAQELEFKQQFGSEATKTPSQIANENRRQGATTVDNVVTVNLNINGNQTSFQFANQESADTFIAQMKALEEINQQGVE